MLSTLKDRLARYRAERHLSPVSREVRARRLTYLSPHRLRTLERCAAEVNTRGVDGDFVEAGVALGGSAVVLASAMGDDRRLQAYDVFARIPPPGENDPPEAHERYATIAEGASDGIGGDTYYGYRPDLHEHVARTFAAFDMPVGDRICLHRACSRTRCTRTRRSPWRTSTATATTPSPRVCGASRPTSPTAA